MQWFPHVWQLLGSVVKLAQSLPQRVLVPQSFTQLPASQICPVAQTWPQVRQFLASVCRLTQVPEQFVLPAEQHTPFVQVPPQALPQPPQLARSVAVFVQVPAVHSAKFVAHLILQALPSHAALPLLGGAGQFLPQLPQFAVAVVKSTQDVPHSCFEPQSVVQVPFKQTWPVAQALPQLPQLVPELFTSTQLPLQFVWPAAQHSPFRHTPAQAVPHFPQFARSVCMSMQRPLQRLSWPSHWMPHLPPMQVAVPEAGGPLQMVEQLPQWLTSVLTAMQDAPQMV